MNLNQFIKSIGAKKQTVILIMVIFVLVSVLITVVQPFKYGSSLKLLTVHSFKETTDPYIASKSNEYLSNLLVKIVYSNSFFEKIKEAGFNIEKDYFKGSEKRQIKKWERTVKAKSIADTGIISLDVYHTDRDQAEQIARAVAYTLQTNHAMYHGFGKNVEIKLIDKPITSNFPVRPNIVLNLSLAIIFGLVFSAVYIYLFPGEEYDLFPRKKKHLANQPKDPEEVEDNWESVGEVMDRSHKEETRETRENGHYEDNLTEEDFTQEANMNNVFKS